MKINRVTIKGASGYCCADEAYEEKISITSSSASYEYRPHPDSSLETNIYRKWSYKTNSPVFLHIFNQIAEMTPEILNRDINSAAEDTGMVEIIVTFEDRHSETATYLYTGEFLAEYFRLIRQMVPSTEYIPVTLLDREDFEGDEIIV